MPRKGIAGPAAPVLGSREGAEVRALGLVITASVCSGAKLLAPLDCLRGAESVLEQSQGHIAE